MTYLLDTDILIYFFNRKEPYASLVEELALSAALTLSVLSVAEIRTGWTQEQAQIYLPRLYDLCARAPVTEDIAEQAGTWRQEYRAKGRTLATPDTIIASTAYLKNYCLVTNNVKDYPMPELQLFRNLSV